MPMLENQPGEARKVPGFKVWMTKDGRALGPKGELKTRTRKGMVFVTAKRDTDGVSSRSVAQLMAETWMDPKPAGAVLDHVNGDTHDNHVSNLAWRPKKSMAAYAKRWRARKLAEMAADAQHPYHGTNIGYQVGCRCKRCKRYQAVRWAKRRTKKTIRELEELCGKTAR